MPVTTSREEITDHALKATLAELDSSKPNGPAFAALIASGIGATALGFLTTLAEASKPVKDALTLNKGVGPLSGKTTFAVVAFAVAWAILAYLMRGRRYRERPLFIATFVLIALGLIGTFPPFYEAFSVK